MDDQRTTNLPSSVHCEVSEQWFEEQLVDCPVVLVEVDSLRLADSPRSAGEDSEHTHVLVEYEGELPPIVVHGATMRVIDGMHRLRAAMLRGQRTIAAKIFHGEERDAFVLAVRMNVTHGLPLSRADRIAAVSRIIASHPCWSNRMIAAASGLANGTVAKIRRRSTGQSVQLDSRVGQDGRVRPLSSAASRQHVYRLLAENPEASLREVARIAGVSPSTVQDVRRRMREGRNPLPDRLLAGGETGTLAPRRQRRQPVVSGDDLELLLTNLRKDPALRFNHAGRSLLHWLHQHVSGMSEWDRIAEAVPTHCQAVIAKIARGYATAWAEFATHLEEQVVQEQSVGLDPRRAAR